VLVGCQQDGVLRKNQTTNSAKSSRIERVVCGRLSDEKSSIYT
jgi:hypothetical protein